ncbi:MAG TPA: hypothetical protein VG165_13240 [Solirubrobacteraceae bacterium]|nr:hypothetical protein [Solirubrobacteraceae bacterium]
MTRQPAPQPLVGFRRWGARRGGLYSGIFVAGRFVPNPALAMIAPRAIPVPWPTDHDRNARCYALGGHEAPHAACGCGYSAYYTLPDEPDLPAPEAVWGAVVAWGRIVECERGFRAEYARPVAVLEARNPLDRREGGRRLERVAERYEIPLLAAGELVAYAGWHGELVV